MIITGMICLINHLHISDFDSKIIRFTGVIFLEDGKKGSPSYEKLNENTIFPIICSDFYKVQIYTNKQAISAQLSSLTDLSQLRSTKSQRTHFSILD